MQKGCLEGVGSAGSLGMDQLKTMCAMNVKVLDLHQLVRAAKRINRAAGYLELGMIPQALTQLEETKDFGPFDPAADLIRAEAFRCQQKHEDAAQWFRQAAHKFANPLRHATLIALSHYLQAALQPFQQPGSAHPHDLRPAPRLPQTAAGRIIIELC